MERVNKDGRAPAADFLRVISIFIIAWYHIWQQSWLNPNIVIGNTLINIYPVITHGYMFVDIMLLISGFLLMLGYIDGRYTSLGKYYVSRAFRIVPSYLFCVLLLFFAFALPQHSYGSTEHMLKDLLPHLTFTHNLFKESYSFTKLNAVLWTLAVEVQFYIVFPFVARVFKRHPAITYLLMLAVSALSKLWVWKVPAETSWYINRLPVMLDVYANGMLAALIYTKLRGRKRGFILEFIHVLLVCAACAGIYFILRKQSYTGDKSLERLGQMLFRYPLTFCGSVFLVCGSLTFRWLRAVFSNRVTRWLCALSYNFYIWHQYLAVKLKQWHIPAYTAEYPNMASEQPWQQQYTLICFGAALLVAAHLYYIIEKPCSRLGNRVLSKIR